MNRQLFEYSYELKKQNKRKTFFTIFYFIFIYLILNIIFSFVLFPVKQVSNSMSPDFPENSISFITKIYKVPDRGDVVLLKRRITTEHKFYEKIWHGLCWGFWHSLIF